MSTKLEQVMAPVRKLINEEDMDYVLVVTGRERIGKSTLALQIAKMMDPKFQVDQMVFDIPQLYNKVYQLEKGQAVVIDEGATSFFSRESMRDDNIEGVKLLTVMGERNLFVILCVPSFFIIDKYIREHRVSALIKVVARGKFQFYSKQKLKQSYYNLKRNKYIWQSPSFEERFTKVTGKIWEDYKVLKADYLKGRRDDWVKEEVKKPDYCFTDEAAIRTMIARNTIQKLCQRDELPGAVKQGVKWLIPNAWVLENTPKPANPSQPPSQATRVSKKTE